MTINHLKNIKFVSFILLTIFNISFNHSRVQAKTPDKTIKPRKALSKIVKNPSLNTRIPSALGNRTQQNLKQTVSLPQQTLIANSFGGRASWYGPGFHGRLTANGEVYNQNAMTAAHPSLQFGTKVKVTNLNNGRSVVVTINDRGPYAGGRVIDLSAAAARSLNMIRSGVAPVQVTILGR